MNGRTRASWLVLAVVWLASAVYLMAALDRGWVPHDDGTLAHAAERVLHGELPHRDFHDVYTGGLAFLNALAFLVFGTSLMTLRIPLLLATLAWIPVVYYVATRFAGPLLAGLAVLVAVVWSVPNYSAAVPSWYNLILTTLGIACVLRYQETRASRWLWFAGFAAGFSVLVKIVGLYLLAAVLLFLVFHEQRLPEEGHRRDPVVGGRNRWLSVTLTAALLTLIGLLFALAGRIATPGSYFHYVLPGAGLAIFLVWNEWARRPAPARERCSRLSRLLLPVLAGTATPLLLFLIPYLITGSVPDLLRGVILAPGPRLLYASFPPPDPVVAIAGLPVFALVAAEAGLRTRERWCSAALFGALALLLLVYGHRTGIYVGVWLSVRSLVPLVVLGGLIALSGSRWGRVCTRPLPEPTFLLLAGVALWSLVQFPYSGSIYFLYVAPLLVLAVLALAPGEWSTRPLLTAVLLFYLLFGVRWLNPGFIYYMGARFVPDDQTARLELERGGIRVSPALKEEYEALVAELHAHQKGGYTFVTPDSPQVYFLSGLRNPTPTIFEFLDDPAGRTERVLQAIDEHDVRVIALHLDPGLVVQGGRLVGAGFSPPPATDLVAGLVQRFPHVTQVASFVVRWRE